jgi:hypothetical protein
VSLPQVPHRGSEKSATAKTPGRTPRKTHFKFCNTIPPKATKLLRLTQHVALYVSSQPKYDAEDRIGRRRDYPRYRVEIWPMRARCPPSQWTCGCTNATATPS